MSNRRKSCDACFKGRRKCDLTYPVCSRCQKNHRICHYTSTLQVAEKGSLDVIGNAINQSTNETASIGWISDYPGQLHGREDDIFNSVIDFDGQESNLLERFLSPNIPDLLGTLGEVQPVSGNIKSWEWVIEQLKSYARNFAQHGETTFIHKNLYRDILPHPIRAAFGVCAVYVCLDGSNKPMLFRTLDAEVLDLLNSASGGSLLDELSRMQAIVLYQIIRLFHGNLEQRIVAEQQETLVGAWGLRLLQRAEVEFRETPSTREAWILAESIRRTVMVAFMIYAVHSIFKHGVCPEFPTLSILPVSNNTKYWGSPGTYLQDGSDDRTVKYADFTSRWLESPPTKIEPYEKMLLVACKGIDQVELFSLPEILD